MTMFDNPDVLELPQFTAQRKIPLAPAYSLSKLVSFTVTVVLAAFAFFIARFIEPELKALIQSEDLPWAAPVLAFMYAWVWISSRYKAYAVRQHDVSFYSGVIFRSAVIQPISRLQHIEISRGALERVFGLATLRLYSAGGASHAVAIPGLHNDTAEALREQISTSQSLQNER